MHPETTLGDRIIYAFLIMTVLTTLDSFFDLSNSESFFIKILRYVSLVAALIYPLKVYVEVMMLYKMYRVFLPEMQNEPEGVKLSGEAMS